MLTILTQADLDRAIKRSIPANEKVHSITWKQGPGGITAEVQFCDHKDGSFVDPVTFTAVANR